MGKRKIEVRKIEDERIRVSTFAKRKMGLVKKAMELSVLCEVDIVLVVFGIPTSASKTGRLTQYASKDVDLLLTRFVEESPSESYTNEDYEMFRSKAEKELAADGIPDSPEDQRCTQATEGELRMALKALKDTPPPAGGYTRAIDCDSLAKRQDSTQKNPEQRPKTQAEPQAKPSQPDVRQEKALGQLETVQGRENLQNQSEDKGMGKNLNMQQIMSKELQEAEEEERQEQEQSVFAGEVLTAVGWEGTFTSYQQLQQHHQSLIWGSDTPAKRSRLLDPFGISWSAMQDSEMWDDPEQREVCSPPFPSQWKQNDNEDDGGQWKQNNDAVFFDNDVELRQSHQCEAPTHQEYGMPCSSEVNSTQHINTGRPCQLKADGVSGQVARGVEGSSVGEGGTGNRA